MCFSVYQINAFSDTLSGGNPACVIPLREWLPDTVLLHIAKKNGVSETAFFVENGDTIALRWFTPDIEMDLCGHATLATAHCLKTILHRKSNSFRFDTRSGKVTVDVTDDVYRLNFPSRMPVEAPLPEIIRKSLSIQPQEVFLSRDYVLVYNNEKEIRELSVHRAFFDRINFDPGGVAVTAPGIDCDFVSRFFTPQATFLEDPVTGSAHCSLTPFWAVRMGKKSLFARQLSERGGELYCEDRGERVIISGKAITYAMGKLFPD